MFLRKSYLYPNNVYQLLSNDQKFTRKCPHISWLLLLHKVSRSICCDCTYTHRPIYHHWQINAFMCVFQRHWRSRSCLVEVVERYTMCRLSPPPPPEETFIHDDDWQKQMVQHCTQCLRVWYHLVTTAWFRGLYILHDDNHHGIFP